MQPLAGQVAVVAGATRGAGRGIARALGEAGAIVYCTGRSVRGNLSPYGRPETIDETVEMINAAGGTAIPIRVDHTVEGDVDALFARVDRDQHRLDVLVNSIAGEDPMMAQGGSFWKTDLKNADAIFRQSLTSHIITAKHAALLMIRARHGLIVEVTENDILSAGSNPMAQVVKLAQKGLALNMATDLAPHGVAAVAITPGFLRSESMLEHKGVTEANWREAGAKDKNFLESESPLFVGRAVAALAADPNVFARSGQLLSSWELARQYKFTDYDGRVPDWGALAIDFSVLPPPFIDMFRTGARLQLEWLQTLADRTRQFLAKIPKALCLVLLMTIGACAPRGTADITDLPTVDAAAMLRDVKPDLEQRLSQFKPVKMPFDAAGLSAGERQMVDQLVIASRDLESMYWRQSDPVGLALYNALASVDTPLAKNVRHYLFINGSRWDLVHENEPFVGRETMPAGHYLYPTDLTRAAVDAYVAAHPDKKSAIYDPYTIVHRDGADLVGRKYHDEYSRFAKGAADALRKAASLSPDPMFARFLRLRADALLTDDYYASDVAWVDLQNPKVDVIFAPYETYLDDLLGVKTSYGASVLIRNEAESRNLEQYQRWVPEIQEALPLAAEDRPSVRGHATPMEVMDAPFRAGDLRHGYQAVADNLPNDPRIHKEKGTKKIFFKNFMDARVNEIILPLAARVMDSAQAKQATGEGYLASTIMHEICHGLGPAFARKDGQQVDIREAMGPAYSGLEESKADVVGMFALKWLVDRGVLPKSGLEQFYASYVAGIFRTVRFGTGEAHGRAEMMELNYLAAQGAIVSAGGRYRVDYAKMPEAIQRLAKELLEQEATGDRARAEAWFKQYDTMPPALRQALDAARDVPIDVDPIFAFDETVK